MRHHSQSMTLTRAPVSCAAMWQMMSQGTLPVDGSAPVAVPGAEAVPAEVAVAPDVAAAAPPAHQPPRPNSLGGSGGRTKDSSAQQTFPRVAAAPRTRVTL